MGLLRHFFKTSGLLLTGCGLIACAVPSSIQTRNQPHSTQLQDKINPAGELGPVMIKIPAGRFMMGSPLSEHGRYETEGPQHPVSIRNSFYLSRNEITVAQFRTFISNTAYTTDIEKQGTNIRLQTTNNWSVEQNINWRHDQAGNISRDDNPVVHISWNDAQAYISWLSTHTNKHYRLPSEAELEYANRAGSTTAYWWGDSPPRDKVANIKGEHDIPPNDPTWYPTANERQYAYTHGYTPMFFEAYSDGYWGLAPVGSFIPNAFGLFDTAGNTWEWTQDCYHETYHGAPDDGSAWVDSGNCKLRVVRGGSYYCFPRHVRSANRWFYKVHQGSMYIGFRVARDADL